MYSMKTGFETQGKLGPQFQIVVILLALIHTSMHKNRYHWYWIS